MTEFTGFKVSKEIFSKGFLFTFTFGASFTTQEFLEFLALVDKLLSSKQKFAMLLDSSLCKHVPVKSVLMLSKWMRNNKLLIAETLIGTSIVISSSIVANLVNQAFKIQKPIRPNKITTSYQESLKFLGEHLK